MKMNAPRSSNGDIYFMIRTFNPVIIWVYYAARRTDLKYETKAYFCHFMDCDPVCLHADTHNSSHTHDCANQPANQHVFCTGDQYRRANANHYEYANGNAD